MTYWPGARTSARADIARIVAAGTRLRILAGRDGVALEEMEQNFGLQGRWLGRRRGVTLSLVRDLDHGLASRRAQDLAIGEILRFLDVTADVRRPGDSAGRDDRGAAPSASRKAPV